MCNLLLWIKLYLGHDFTEGQGEPFIVILPEKNNDHLIVTVSPRFIVEKDINGRLQEMLDLQVCMTFCLRLFDLSLWISVLMHVCTFVCVGSYLSSLMHVYLSECLMLCSVRNLYLWVNLLHEDLQTRERKVQRNRIKKRRHAVVREALTILNSFKNR